jgi:type IV pilus assembly protein PilA
MFCNQCGHNNPESNRFCANCGQPLGAEAPATTPSAYPPMPAGVPLPDARTDGMAVASLVLGILGVTVFFLVASIPAIVLGHISYSKIKKSLGRLKGQGMALAGLILGYLGILILPTILIIAAIAIPNLLRSRMAANEASAVGSLRTVNVAALTYKQMYKRYPESLQHMDGAESGTVDAQHAQLIDETLASGRKAGFDFTYRCTETGAEGACTRYFASAEPVSRGSTGQREFCTAEDGIIRYEMTGRCTRESPALR